MKHEIQNFTISLEIIKFSTKSQRIVQYSDVASTWNWYIYN